MTIINNGLFADEVVLSIFNPIFYVPDPDKGKPVDGAQIFFGLVGTDPALESNQKIVYALQEDRAAVAVSQPVLCSAGGVPQLDGSSAILAVSGSYSMKILDKNGEQKYYFPIVEQANNQGFNGIIAEESQTVAGSLTLTYAEIEATTSSFYISSSTDGLSFTGAYLRKDIDYRVDSSTTITLLNASTVGTVVLGRQMDPTGQIIPVASGASSLFVYPLKANAIASDLEIGSVVTINNGSSAGDKLGGARYVTVAGGTGSNDGINYIDLNNGNQLELLPNLQKFALYSEVTNAGSVSGGVLTLDLSKGQVFSSVISESITVNMLVYNQGANLTTTVSIKIKQDAIGGRTVAWPSSVKWAGGTPPVATTAGGAIDRFVLITDDAGLTWEGIIVGRDFS